MIPRTRCLITALKWAREDLAAGRAWRSALHLLPSSLAMLLVCCSSPPSCNKWVLMGGEMQHRECPAGTWRCLSLFHAATGRPVLSVSVNFQDFLEADRPFLFGMGRSIHGAGFITFFGVTLCVFNKQSDGKKKKKGGG